MFKSRPLIAGLIIVFCAFSAFGFSWFGNDSKKKPEPKSSSGTVASPAVSKTEGMGVSSAQNAKSTALKAAQPGAIVNPPPRKEIEKLENDIQEVIKLNEQVKPQYKKQKEELQRIGEWAKLNQRILSQMKGNGVLSKTPYKTSDTEEIIRQEKLRLIQQETIKNREFIKKMKKETENVQRLTKMKTVKDQAAAFKEQKEKAASGQKDSQTV